MAAKSSKQVDKKRVGSDAWVVTSYGVPNSKRKTVLKSLYKDLGKTRRSVRHKESTS